MRKLSKEKKPPREANDTCQIYQTFYTQLQYTISEGEKEQEKYDFRNLVNIKIRKLIKLKIKRYHT